jgi:hypothetical protein
MKIIRIEIWNDYGPPYNYYKISKVCEDESDWVLAHIDAELYGIVEQIAAKIANYYDVPVADRRAVPGQLIK